ncbi:T9SS type A sorting domain-containing protein [Gracilimonas mengyeensis]|uniref:Por secretion system C-terminal sorting domain-containing protein n=1 Tax=Gracilimonas mengyeensis TaxID=1302730 RepID=A0A521FF75_9BACT|nr:T9SS type A sorting domain-containing protein [Gracilimonas mengyeensis]SMO94200.1 Por secretion system C-terminal sorting domain-containing protein [Gracilimonas mengyeensis]
MFRHDTIKQYLDGSPGRKSSPLSKPVQWITTFSVLVATLVAGTFTAMAQDSPGEGYAINEADSLALVAYYHSTNGDQWNNNDGWLTSDPVFTWVGIEEVENVAGDDEPADWRVTVIDMPRNNMTVPGPIPPEIENMEFLEDFKADVNLHSGNLPPEIANLDRLLYLLVRTNLFTGEVDWNAFGSMPAMDQFRIRQNYFSGPLPETLGGNGTWPSLTRFYVDDNRFTGSIPQVHEDLTTLNRVYFHNNQLTGPIPDWSQLEGMEYYRIANNDLEPGPIPQWIFEAWGETLIRFQIQNTNRTGSLPQEIAQMEALEQFTIGGPGDTIGEGETTADIPNMSFMPSLRRINFYGGGWTGPLPEWVGEVANLEDVHFENLEVTGEIPASWANADLVSLHLENLDIEGGIPAAFSVVNSLQEITLIDNENMTVGEIPAWIGGSIGSIEILQLENVGVTGDIGDNNLLNLPLEVLDLSDNPELTGSLPTWFQTKNWSTLELSRTGIELDEIPTWLADMDNLSYLGLAGLGLEGEIPSFFGEGDIAVNLNVLALNDNNLTGGIPASLGNALLLDSLNLSNNNLSRSIPAELANAGRATNELSLLSALQLSGNPELTGEIPLAFTDADFMRVLEYDGTDLCEPDDASFEEWIAGIPDYAAESYPIAYYNVSRTNVSCADVSNELTDNPNRFRLQQNYPNPFNPSTTIKYEIPEATNVTLTVYNMLGQKVGTLVNTRQTAGLHEVQFDASSLASGSYMYRLEAGDRVSVQQMMLIK